MHGKEGPIKVSFFSEQLGVSDRTVQSAITVAPVFSEGGKQQGNLYHWTGDVDSVIGSPTLEMLYARYDSYGFRSFTWDDFKMERDPSGNYVKNFVVLMFAPDPSFYIPYAYIEVITNTLGSVRRIEVKEFKGPIWKQYYACLDYLSDHFIRTLTILQSCMKTKRLEKFL